MSGNLGNTMQKLYERFGELPGIRIELYKELLAISIDNDSASATIFLQGAQLTHYQRHNEAAVIWCSETCDYQSGTPLRGGIPVCWPWFGQADKNPPQVRQQLPLAKAPAHGFVRNRLWQVEEIKQPHPHTTELTLSLDLSGQETDFWPFATKLNMHFIIGEQLNVSLSINNLSDHTVTFSGALHTYLAVNDISAVSINGLEGLGYIDCLRDWTPQQQQGPLRFDQETDRIYHGTGVSPITLVDNHGPRAIVLTCRGSNSAIVWNPWIEKARRLSNFPAEAYRKMLCIETANADRDIITLAPQKAHQLSLTISSQTLN